MAKTTKTTEQSPNEQEIKQTVKKQTAQKSTEQKKTQPAKAQTAKTQTAKAQPAKAQSAKTQTTKAQPAKAQSAKTQATKVQPAKAQTTKTVAEKKPATSEKKVAKEIDAQVVESKEAKTAETTLSPEFDGHEFLEVKDLCQYFVVDRDFFGKPIKFLKAVDGVSFKLKKGKTLGIVGESGCGKTTMGRTILRLYDITSGEVWFKGQKVSDLKNRAFDKLRPNMQMIFQDPYASLSPRLTVGEIIGEAALQHGIVDKAHYHEYILSVMKMCGLQPHYFERYPHEFSGGQRQRICIARALALKPELVICDEPVSALDVSIQAQIINMLIELRKTLGLTYVFISHDLSVVKHISDEVGVMYLGSLVEYGSKDSIFENTLHPYTKALLSAVPVPNPHVKMNRIILKGDIPSPVNPPKGCKFHTRCEYCKDICGRIAPVYKEVEEGHFCACHLYNTEEETAALEENYRKELELAESKKEQKAERNLFKGCLGKLKKLVKKDENESLEQAEESSSDEKKN
jgi:peptide/nickel transport system ATP-binding protein